jgi:hypothetical protein
VSISIASSSRDGVAVPDGVAVACVLMRPPLFLGGMLTSEAPAQRNELQKGNGPAIGWNWGLGNVEILVRGLIELEEQIIAGKKKLNACDK